MSTKRPLRVPLSLAMAAILGLLAIVLPSQCRVNEQGHRRARGTGDLSLGPPPATPQAARFAAACGEATPPSPPLIDRGPYLQLQSPGETSIVWVGRATRPQVAIWPADAQSAPQTLDAAVDSTATPKRGRQFVASASGLLASAIHCYEIRDGDQTLAGPFGFTAPPAPAQGVARPETHATSGTSRPPLRMVALGDMGDPTGDQRAVIEAMGGVAFDLALLTGDIAYPRGTLDEFERNVFDPYAELMHSAIFFPASGNHDYLTADAAPFREVFVLPRNGGESGIERWYSVDWGNLHIVVLDTERVGHTQTAWLEADLTSNRLPWVIAVLHRPPFSSGVQGRFGPAAEQLHPILARHRVPLVLAGHEHNYERRKPQDGVTYVITGGGGRGTRPIAPSEASAYAEQVAHFTYIEVDDQAISLWAIDAEGNLFDSVSLVSQGGS